MGIYIILYLISRPKAMCTSDDIVNHKGLGLDSLKSILNRDMEEKGIVLPELSCRTAADIPPPELHECRQNKVCMHVGAPETQNNTQNPRKSVVFVIRLL